MHLPSWVSSFQGKRCSEAESSELLAPCIAVNRPAWSLEKARKDTRRSHEIQHAARKPRNFMQMMPSSRPIEPESTLAWQRDLPEISTKVWWIQTGLRFREGLWMRARGPGS